MVYRQTARSEAVRAASRERILSAALKLFVDKGFDATTMQEIVTEAGTSIGNAYFYFGSKDQLVTEVIESTAHALLDGSERAAESIPAGPARIGVLIATRVDAFLSAQRPLAHLLVDTDQRLGTIDRVEDMTIERWVPQLAVCFPDLDPAELPAVATSIWGVNRAFVARAVRGRLVMDRVAAVTFLVRWTLRALRVDEADIESVLRTSLAPLDGVGVS